MPVMGWWTVILGRMIPETLSEGKNNEKRVKQSIMAQRHEKLGVFKAQ